MDQALTSTTRRRGHQHHPRHATRRRLDASSRGPAQCGPAVKSAVATGDTLMTKLTIKEPVIKVTTTTSSVATTIVTTTTSRLDCHATNNNEILASRITVGSEKTNNTKVKTSLADTIDKYVTKLNAEESDDKIIKDGPKSVELRPARCGLAENDDIRLDDRSRYDDETDNRVEMKNSKLEPSEIDQFDVRDCINVIGTSATLRDDDKIVSRRSAGRTGTREPTRVATRSRTKDSGSPEPEHAVARARGDGNSDDETTNVEEDPELAELAKLRCPSERTEVQAEREARRRKRCADYPGLAFGSSIFSSDTMMKFSLIRNELKNIMGNQLKRIAERTRSTERI